MLTVGALVLDSHGLGLPLNVTFVISAGLLTVADKVRLFGVSMSSIRNCTSRVVFGAVDWFGISSIVGGVFGAKKCRLLYWSCGFSPLTLSLSWFIRLPPKSDRSGPMMSR